MKIVSKTNSSGKSAAKSAPAQAEPPAKVASLTIGETPSVPGTTPKAAEVAPLASNPAPAIVETAAPVVTELPISTIRLDGGTQSRASLSTTTIAEYAEAMTAGAKFPPVVVFYDGKTRWLADGFHRVNASLKVGRDRIACEVRQGSQRDAILFSVAANATHGLRRTNADKRHAVEMLLGDAKWSKKSDRWIADTCGVSNNFVGVTRKQVSSDDTSKPETREGRDGKQQPATKPKARPPSVAPARLVALPVVTVDPEAAFAEALDRLVVGYPFGHERLVAALKACALRARDLHLKEAANG